MINRRWVLCGGLAFAFALALPAGAAEVSDTAVVIATRAEVSVAAYLTEPTEPARAAAILFAGGAGSLGIKPGIEVPTPEPQRSGNFLVRSRRLLAGHGVVVLTPDAPSDLNGSMPGPFRLSDDHVADIAALAAWLKARTGGLPVWLIGTSMGTFSAAIGAARLGEAVDGVVLTSTITRANRYSDFPSDGVMRARLERIRVPALVVAHAADTCSVTPPEDVSRLVRALSGSPRVESRLFSGGGQPRSDSCEALSHHGYIGQEDEVIAAIAAFMLAGAPLPPG